MSQELLRENLKGCYITIPTMFSDKNLDVDTEAIQNHVRFLLDQGVKKGNGIILAAGAAGDFSTLSFEERRDVALAVVEAAGGKVPVTVGAQTTDTRELIKLAKKAEDVGAQYIQVSPPFYFGHTEGDFYEFILSASDATSVGLIIYNTYWTTPDVSMGMIEKLVKLPNVAGLKWSVPAGVAYGMERVVVNFGDTVSVIDNMGHYVTTHMLGARGIEIHTANYWPKWAVYFWNLLENQSYIEAQQQLMKVVVPFYKVWAEMSKYTAGDGYLDKLCMELVGLGSSRNRPPTRDVREEFREMTLKMLQDTGVPNLIS